MNLRDTKLLILFKNLKKKIQSYKAQNKNWIIFFIIEENIISVELNFEKIELKEEYLNKIEKFWKSNVCFKYLKKINKINNQPINK